jgi:hypothetical protein
MQVRSPREGQSNRIDRSINPLLPVRSFRKKAKVHESIPPAVQGENKAVVPTTRTVHGKNAANDSRMA